MAKIELSHGRTFDEKTNIMTFADGTEIQTEDVSKEAQEGAEEYLKILESGEKTQD